jgi:hypothetical protein
MFPGSRNRPNDPGQHPPAGSGADPVTTAALRLPSADTREAALYRRFSALGISWTTHAHAPVFTVEEARALRGILPGTHTKNLFLEDKKGVLWLISAREELSIDLNAFAKTIGRQMSRRLDQKQPILDARGQAAPRKSVHASAGQDRAKARDPEDATYRLENWLAGLSHSS